MLSSKACRFRRSRTREGERRRGGGESTRALAEARTAEGRTGPELDWKVCRVEKTPPSSLRVLVGPLDGRGSRGEAVESVQMNEVRARAVPFLIFPLLASGSLLGGVFQGLIRKDEREPSRELQKKVKFSSPLASFYEMTIKEALEVIASPFTFPADSSSFLSSLATTSTLASLPVFLAPSFSDHPLRPSHPPLIESLFPSLPSPLLALRCTDVNLESRIPPLLRLRHPWTWGEQATTTGTPTRGIDQTQRRVERAIQA